MLLDKINSPADLKKLSFKELDLLKEEIREVLLQKLSAYGGHVGPNLGTVELVMAMHYVFNSPVDKFVFDVSHQCYVHKILTGRKQAFMEKEHYSEVTGFTNPNESAHDWFKIGHTSTSISLANGLAKARDLKGETNNVVAVIGDGSLSGGEAYEGLNNVVENGTNTIVIVNDNNMSIAENYGGLYKNLRDLRESNGTHPCNFFKAMGFDYYYVADGHNIEQLVEVFTSVKDADHPVIVHVQTIKGKGYQPAEEKKEAFHVGPAFDRETGEYVSVRNKKDSYAAKTAAFLLDEMKKDPKVAAVVSGTPGGFAMTSEWRKQAGKQYIDVGIAEEHAIAMISGMAKNGVKPVYSVFSTFLQRTYDQLSHDLCLNSNPATILVYSASINGMRDDTHVGIFDIAMIGNIPNLVYLAPTCEEEYFAMLRWSMEQNEHPVAIRVPGTGVVSSGKEDMTDYSVLNRYEVTKQGSKVAVIALGGFYGLGEEVVESLAKEAGIHATLINPKYITALDEELLERLKEDHEYVITLEDGVLEGGFGEKIASFYGPSKMRVKNYGIKKSFPDRYVPEELLRENGISVKQIVADTMAVK